MADTNVKIQKESFAVQRKKILKGAGMLEGYRDMPEVNSKSHLFTQICELICRVDALEAALIRATSVTKDEVWYKTQAEGKNLVSSMETQLSDKKGSPVTL